jgi:hypothetical protein
MKLPTDFGFSFTRGSHLPDFLVLSVVGDCFSFSFQGALLRGHATLSSISPQEVLVRPSPAGAVALAVPVSLSFTDSAKPDAKGSAPLSPLSPLQIIAGFQHL